MFSCNLPPALLAEWPGSCMCYCSNTLAEWIPKWVCTESWPLRRNFSQRSCGDWNLWPFSHESGALTTELSPLPSGRDWGIVGCVLWQGWEVFVCNWTWRLVAVWNVSLRLVAVWNVSLRLVAVWNASLRLVAVWNVSCGILYSMHFCKWKCYMASSSVSYY